jgi:chromosome segregation ATPase
MKDKNVISAETSSEISNTEIDDNLNISLNSEEKSHADSDDDASKIQSSILSENNTVESIPESVKKLEIRFKETMEKVAELTDEKQRLEHLVLQLQGETETIGNSYLIYHSTY